MNITIETIRGPVTVEVSRDTTVDDVLDRLVSELDLDRWTNWDIHSLSTGTYIPKSVHVTTFLQGTPFDLLTLMDSDNNEAA